MNLKKLVFQYIDTLRYKPQFELKGGIANIIRGPIIPTAIVAFFIGMAGIIVFRYLSLEVWRHDSFHYTLNSQWYEGNLKGEGRWIIYFLFDLLKPIPGHFAALVNLLCCFLFGYLITTSLVKDKYLGIIFGLSILLIPVLHAQNMWPNITMAAFVFLPICYFLSKKLHPFLLFAISAVFFFGTQSHFYFLVPLVYLGRINESLTGKIKRDSLDVILKYLLPYSLCFILGFIVANAVVTLKTGGPIEVGEWRKPTPVYDFDQLISNFSVVHERLFLFTSKFLSEAHSLVWVGITLITLLSLNIKRVWVLIVLIVMFLSPFYTTLYHGILISDRTLMTAAIPFVAIFILLPSLRFKFNILHYLLCLALMWPFFQSSSKQLDLFAKITGYYKEQLKIATVAIDPESYNEFYVFVRNSEIVELNKQIKNHYGNQFKWGESLSAVNRTVVTALRSLGYKNVFLVADNESIKQIKSQINAGAREGPYSIVGIPDRPSAFGVVMNNTVVDTVLLKKL